MSVDHQLGPLAAFFSFTPYQQASYTEPNIWNQLIAQHEKEFTARICGLLLQLASSFQHLHQKFSNQNVVSSVFIIL